MGEHLNQYLSKSQCYCLNEDATLNLANLLMGTGTGLKSNADEQLLIHLAMNQTVKVSNIRLTLPEDETCPHTVKIYANKSSLGFDEALGNISIKLLLMNFSNLFANADLKPTQEAKLTQGVAIQTINLLAAKFQRVESSTWSYNPSFSLSSNFFIHFLLF